MRRRGEGSESQTECGLQVFTGGCSLVSLRPVCEAANPKSLSNHSSWARWRAAARVAPPASTATAPVAKRRGCNQPKLKRISSSQHRDRKRRQEGNEGVGSCVSGTVRTPLPLPTLAHLTPPSAATGSGSLSKEWVLRSLEGADGQCCCGREWVGWLRESGQFLVAFKL